MVAGKFFFLGTRCKLLRELPPDDDGLEIYAPDFTKDSVKQLMSLLYSGKVNVNQVPTYQKKTRKYFVDILESYLYVHTGF